MQFALQANYKFTGPLGSQGRANATLTHVDNRVMFLGGNKPAPGFVTIDLGVNFVRDNVTLALGLATAWGITALERASHAHHAHAGRAAVHGH
jgi:hypothetical protein